MEKQPLVSVILTTDNSPQLLANALRSLARQTYANFEVLVVGNGGPDVTEQVRKADIGHPVSYFPFPQRQQPATVRNAALRAAKGAYIAYLDDKDLFYPRHLERLALVLRDNPDIGAAYSDAHQGRPYVFANGLSTVRKEELPAREFDQMQLLISNFIPLVCMMHRASCLEQTGLFDESLSVLEDWDLWIRISQHAPMRRVPFITAQLTATGSRLVSRSGRIAESIDTLLTIYRKYEMASSENTLLAHLRMRHIVGLYRELAELHEQDGENEKAEQLWQRIAELSGQPEDLLRLGLLRRKMGKEDQARLTLNLAKELRPPYAVNGDY